MHSLCHEIPIGRGYERTVDGGGDLSPISPHLHLIPLPCCTRSFKEISTSRKNPILPNYYSAELFQYGSFFLFMGDNPIDNLDRFWMSKMKNYEYSLDAKDAEFFKGAFQKFINDGGSIEKLRDLIESADFIPNTLESINSELSIEVFNSIINKKNQNLVIIRDDMRKFEDRLNTLWKEPFELFETLIYVSQEICEEVDVTVVDDERRKQDLVFYALVRLHCRACQIAQEILKLMQTGFPDGAIARWRTLHEITVISYFIRKNGQEVANKFLLHDAIESYNSIEK